MSFRDAWIAARDCPVCRFYRRGLLLCAALLLVSYWLGWWV